MIQAMIWSIDTANIILKTETRSESVLIGAFRKTQY